MCHIMKLAKRMEVILQSPFLYKPGSIFEEAPERVIQMSDMHQLIKNKTLDEIDIKIMMLIHNNVFLTAGLIGKHFEGETFFTSSFAKNRMRKFVKYGLARRFYVTFDGKEAIHNRTVNFYGLSEASMKYLKKYFGYKSYDIGTGDLARVGDILSILSMNQAIINYSKSTSSFESVVYDRLKSPREMYITMYNKDFKIVCLRRDKPAKATESKSGHKFNQLLHLVEDELFAVELSKNWTVDHNHHPLFITDLMMVSEYLRDSYLMIKKESSIVEYKLEGLVMIR